CAAGVSPAATGPTAPGAPSGTCLGGHPACRATFLAMAAAGAAALAFLLATLPSESYEIRDTPSLRDQLRTLAAAPVCLGLLANCVLMTGSIDRKSTRLNSSHVKISYAVFCLK